LADKVNGHYNAMLLDFVRYVALGAQQKLLIAAIASDVSIQNVTVNVQKAQGFRSKISGASLISLWKEERQQL